MFMCEQYQRNITQLRTENVSILVVTHYFSVPLSNFFLLFSFFIFCYWFADVDRW